MRKDYLELDGRKVRVEVNWNAIVAHLDAAGRNTLDALAGIQNIKPTDIAGLMAAAINEGERLDGRESHLTAEEIGSIRNSIDAIGEFITIFARQTSRETEPEEEKKD